MLYVQVCINREGQYYAAGYLSVYSDNIILYRYVLMEKDNNMLLDILVFLLTISFDVYHASIIHMHVRILL